MQYLKTYEQFNNKEKLDEGLFTANKYDVLKKYVGKTVDEKLIKEIWSALNKGELYVTEFVPALVKAGVAKEVAEFLNKVWAIGTSKTQLITLDEESVKQSLNTISQLSTMDKNKQKEEIEKIKKMSMYRLKKAYANVPKEEWTNKFGEMKKAEIPKVFVSEDGKSLVIKSAKAAGPTSSGPAL